MERVTGGMASSERRFNVVVGEDIDIVHDSNEKSEKLFNWQIHALYK
jgi:hypothetical protein